MLFVISSTSSRLGSIRMTIRLHTQMVSNATSNERRSKSHHRYVNNEQLTTEEVTELTN